MNRIVWWLLLYPLVSELCSLLQFLQRIEYNDDARFARGALSWALYLFIAAILWRHRRDN